MLLEDNPLTAWAIEQALAPIFEVRRCEDVKAALSGIQRCEVHGVICGSPTVEERPEAVNLLAQASGGRVVALVSGADNRLAPDVVLLEKPFELRRLIELLKCIDRSAKPQVPPPSPSEPASGSLADRLRTRFEQEICPRCVHQTADGGCTLTEQLECPAFEWARQISEAVADIDSSRLADYMDRIQAIVCPSCRQRPDGSCPTRDHLDCPLDLYLGLIVPIVEQELARSIRPGGNPAKGL